jgi:hypothetical protein
MQIKIRAEYCNGIQTSIVLSQDKAKFQNHLIQIQRWEEIQSKTWTWSHNIAALYILSPNIFPTFQRPGPLHVHISPTEFYTVNFDTELPVMAPASVWTSIVTSISGGSFAFLTRTCTETVIWTCEDQNQHHNDLSARSFAFERTCILLTPICFAFVVQWFRIRFWTATVNSYATPRKTNIAHSKSSTCRVMYHWSDECELESAHYTCYKCIQGQSSHSHKLFYYIL